MTARILIVDDHDVVRQGTRAILEKARPEWEICGEAATGREAIGAVAKHKPDVVILDISMPDMTGIEAAPVIAKMAPNTRILLFTMHESDALLVEAKQLGAQGYLQKSQAGRDLVMAVDRLLAGGTFFGPSGNSEAGSPGENEGDASNHGISSRIDNKSVEMRKTMRAQAGKIVLRREDLTVCPGGAAFTLKQPETLILKYLAPLRQCGVRLAFCSWAGRVGISLLKNLASSREAYHAHTSPAGC